MAKLDPELLHRRLRRALNVGGNTHTPDDIALAVGEGRMQSWVNGDSLVVTEVMQFPRKNALNVVLAVGNLEEVLATIPDFEAFAREHGCSLMRMEGRKGWARVLPAYGWAQDNKVIFERSI
jgi:hypothetical protein